jgi:protein-S-isoprenylcysteine O-methyltransferase Ste14
MWLAIRSVAWVLVIPGLVTVYIPWAFFGLGDVTLSGRDVWQLAGIACIAAGLPLFVMCVWDFATRGRGTLSPVDPPKTLVVGGLYRHVRNPMYAAVLLILIGEGLLTHSLGHFEYVLGWFIWINLVVLFYEEPALRRQFGAAFDTYAASVPRWLPRIDRSL